MTKNRWWWIAIIAICAAALVAAGCGDDDDSGDAGADTAAAQVPEFPAGSTMASIQDEGTLVVGTKFDQPLFGLKNPTNDQIEGFDVEIANLIAEGIFGSDIDGKVEFVETPSKIRESAIANGRVDMVVATYTINDERKQQVGFAGPYYVAGQDIMVKADDDSITGVEDLNGKKVCSVQGSTMAKLKDAGKVRVGTKIDQPLFGLKNLDGKLEGFDVEIAKLIAGEMGVQEANIEWIEAVSANREPYIQQDKVDFVVATYTINDKRKQVVDFAGPYYEAGQDIMVAKGNPEGIAGPDDLAGKKVCSVTGSTPAENIRTNYSKAELTEFDVYSKCAEALKNGQVQAVTTDNVILLGLISQDQEAFELVGKPFTKEPYGIGVKKGDTQFRTFINDTLEKAFQDGRWLAAWDATAGKVAPDKPTPPTIDRY